MATVVDAVTVGVVVPGLVAVDAVARLEETPTVVLTGGAAVPRGHEIVVATVGQGPIKDTTFGRRTETETVTLSVTDPVTAPGEVEVGLPVATRRRETFTRPFQPVGVVRPATAFSLETRRPTRGRLVRAAPTPRTGAAVTSVPARPGTPAPRPVLGLGVHPAKGTGLPRPPSPFPPVYTPT